MVDNLLLKFLYKYSKYNTTIIQPGLGKRRPWTTTCPVSSLSTFSSHSFLLSLSKHIFSLSLHLFAPIYVAYRQLLKYLSLVSGANSVFLDYVRLVLASVSRR